MFNTMLVEDNPSFREVLKDTLKSRFSSMSITEAADGEEALEKIDALPPDLIFMDIKLPGKNGLELTGSIRTDHPEIVIIILTSHDWPEYREAAMRYKADHFLSKSEITADEIFKLVSAILLEKGFDANGSDDRKATA